MGIAIICMLTIVLGWSTAAQAWDVVYDAGTGLLPTQTSPSWLFDSYGAPVSVEDGLLHIGNSAAGGAGYRRETAEIAAGVPVTIEASMRLTASTYGSAVINVGTYSTYVGATVRSSRMGTYNGDFTEFRTIRLAYDGVSQAYIWVDGQLARSWTAEPWDPATGTPAGVRFGSDGCDSYWQYVAYSKEFLPLPEPSSLLALFTGVGGIGGLMWRRRTRS